MKTPVKHVDDGPGRCRAALLALLGLLATLAPAQAHPHIIIAAKAQIMFNAQGQVVGVTNVWDFDDAFSAFAIQGYDSKGDGQPTREDLQPLAEINLTALKEYNYFTRMKLGNVLVPLGRPEDYYDVFANERLTLHFTLRPAKPVDVRGKTFQLDVYDPEYFAAVAFAEGKPVDLIGAGTGCNSIVHRPEPLEPGIASRLAVIPADQRTLPPELFAITNALVNAVVVTCR